MIVDVRRYISWMRKACRTLLIRERVDELDKRVSTDSELRPLVDELVTLMKQK